MQKQPAASQQHQKECNRERSYSPVSDDIGDKGSDNYDNFDSDGPNSGDQSMRGRNIHIKSNSELNLGGLSAEGSPDSKKDGPGIVQSRRQSIEQNASYSRQGIQSGPGSASVKGESINGTRFYQALPPPIMNHGLAGYQDGVPVPKTPRELDRRSVDTDQAMSMSNRSDRTKSVKATDTKDAPKANTASRWGYLDNILAPNYYGEVDSENNLSAEEDESRAAVHSDECSSERDASYSEKESDAYSDSGFTTLNKIKRVNLRSKKITDASDSGSVQSKMSKRKPKGRSVNKRGNHSGRGASGSNSEESVDLVQTPALASASVTESMTPSQTESASGAQSKLWEGPLIPDLDNFNSFSRSEITEARGIRPFEPNPGEEVENVTIV